MFPFSSIALAAAPPTSTSALPALRGANLSLGREYKLCRTSRARTAASALVSICARMSPGSSVKSSMQSIGIQVRSEVLLMCASIGTILRSSAAMPPVRRRRRLGLGSVRRGPFTTVNAKAASAKVSVRFRSSLLPIACAVRDRYQRYSGGTWQDFILGTDAAFYIAVVRDWCATGEMGLAAGRGGTRLAP